MDLMEDPSICKVVVNEKVPVPVKEPPKARSFGFFACGGVLQDNARCCQMLQSWPVTSPCEKQMARVAAQSFAADGASAV